MRRWWTAPWAMALGAGLLVLAAAFAPPLWLVLSGQAPPQAATGHGLPWQVEAVGPGRTRVFGIEPGRSRLSDLPLPADQVELAVVAAVGETGVLEAYVERFDAGFVAGRLVVAARAEPADRARWQRAAVTREPGAGEALRHRLGGRERAEALSSVIDGLTFIPNAQVDAAALLQRFGAPAERLRTGERLEQWLYPSIGLAITLDAEGREVMQYVAPAVFDARLRAPLSAPSAASGAAAGP